MNIRLQFSEKELRTIGVEHYRSKESNRYWFRLYAAIIFMGMLITLGLVNFMEWKIATLLLFIALPFWYFVAKGFRAIYCTVSINKYVRDFDTVTSSSIELQQEGLKYIYNSDSVTYSWSGVRAVKELPGSFISIQLLEQEVIVAPSSFSSENQRLEFLQTLEKYRKGATETSGWWTQSDLEQKETQEID
jgi:hypothetical protein